MQSHRTLVCLAAASAALAATAVARANSSAVYPRRQVSFLIDYGVFRSLHDPQSFHPEQPLSPALLDRMLAAIPDSRPVGLRRGRLTVAQVDAAFVESLGLSGVAADVARGLRASGLEPKPGAGLEVVARTLGLRHNYPADLDERERLPSDTAIRIDGAYATWKMLRQQDWRRPRALRQWVVTLVSDRRQRDLTRAIQQQQHPPAHHIAQSAIGLSPIPCLAQLLRKGAPARARVRGDQLPYR